MQTLWHDRRYGARLLAQRPGFALIAVVTLALLGTALGLAGAFALTRWLKTLLFGVSVTDPLTFGVIAVGRSRAGELSARPPRGQSRPAGRASL